jgi:hypothetical protein
MYIMEDLEIIFSKISESTAEENKSISHLSFLESEFRTTPFLAQNLLNNELIVT